MSPVLLPRLKAPRVHGELLVYPPLESVGELLRDNRERFAGSILGRPLADLRELARRETLSAAHAYLAAAGEPIPDFDSSTWLVAGHQPELFHPGVWVKNFILQSLARQHGATPLNLVVDNDVAKSAALRVPAGERVVSIPFDEAGGESPFEERRVQDEGMFDSLPLRLEPLTRDWPFRPWADGVWCEMRRVAGMTPLLGERIVRARRALERSMGLAPLEVPLSAMCRTSAFAWFACGLLADLPRFVADYNSAVHDYRTLHGLKSKNHPAPDLARQGEAYEAPLWIWRTDSPRRQRLFAVRDRSGLQLFAGSVPLAFLKGEPADWVAAWPNLERQGIKIRTRALSTTLYSRLLLGDVFLHGIGGGKYDEVTDAIIERFFNRRAPRFLIVTATLLPPFDRRPANELDDTLRSLQRQQRELTYNPQRHLDESDGAREGIERKRLAVAMPETTHDQRVARFRELQDATARLRPFTSERLRETKDAIHDVEHERHREDVLAARDYSFCLYPEEMLRTFFKTCSPASAE